MDKLAFQKKKCTLFETKDARSVSREKAQTNVLSDKDVRQAVFRRDVENERTENGTRSRRRRRYRFADSDDFSPEPRFRSGPENINRQSLSAEIFSNRNAHTVKTKWLFEL